MKSILGVLLAAITFLSHPFFVHGQDAQDKIKYTMLKAEIFKHESFADGSMDVLITPKATNDNIKWVCKELIKKYHTKYLYIYFWTTKEQYQKDGGMAMGHNFAHYDGNKYGSGIHVTFRDGSMGYISE